jgi:hypothetical protein
MALSRESVIRLKILLDTRPRGWPAIAQSIILNDCYPDWATFVRQHIQQSEWANVTYNPEDPLGENRMARSQLNFWPVGNNTDGD